MEGPFAIERRDGALFMSLDTPGSRVNIFDNRAARQLIDAVAGIDPSNTCALVLRSNKPGSFVNGVGLLMAATVKNPSAAAALSATVRDAYRHLREAPVTTIAAIDGNAYGCGVELALCCDRRVATKSADTRFYMTEINDYLFNPIFGATVTLPLVVGLDRAADLLLWGARWTADVALAHGLVDHATEAAALDGAVTRMLGQHGHNQLPARGPSATRAQLERVLTRHRSRIQRLPPRYQPLYRGCLNLMARVARRGHVTEADRERELWLAGASVAEPMSKAALSFFFIRQTAHALMVGETQRDAIALQVSPALGALGRALSTRQVAGAVVSRSRPAGRYVERYLLVPAASRARPRRDEHVVRVGSASLHGVRTGSVLHSRERPPNVDALLELASRQPTRASRVLYAHLVRIGLRAIVSQPTAAFALDRMLCAYLAPLVAALDRGSSVDTIDATLRAFGFCRRAPALLSLVDTMALAEHLAGDRGVAATRAALGRLARTPRGSGRGQARIQRALLLSLLDAARALLADGTLAHPTTVDVVARELLDFPLCHGSMCTLLTRARVAELLSAERTLRDLLDDGVLARAEEYASGNADFYL